MNLKGKTFWEMEKESISYALKNENVWKNLAVIAANVKSSKKMSANWTLLLKRRMRIILVDMLIRKTSS